MWFRIADGGSVINGATLSSFLKGQQKKLLLKVRALCRSYMKANICFRWAAPSSIYISLHCDKHKFPNTNQHFNSHWFHISRQVGFFLLDGIGPGIILQSPLGSILREEQSPASSRLRSSFLGDWSGPGITSRDPWSPAWRKGSTQPPANSAPPIWIVVLRKKGGCWADAGLLGLSPLLHYQIQPSGWASPYPQPSLPPLRHYHSAAKIHQLLVFDAPYL